MLVADIGREAGCTFAQHRPHMALCQTYFCSAVLHWMVTEQQYDFCEYRYLQVTYGKSCETAKEVKKGSLGAGWILDTAFGVFRTDVWAAASAPHS